MIKVKFSEKNNFICEVKVSGHSDLAEYGEDILCASVSSIITTTINAIVRIDSGAITYVDKEGFVTINVLKEEEVINTLLINMIDLFKELEKQYKKYIKIYK